MSINDIPLLPKGEIDLVELSNQVDWNHPTEFAKTLFSLERNYEMLLKEIEANPRLARLTWQGGKTLLHVVATDCQPAITEVLIRLGANLSADYDGMGTALHEAARSSCATVAEALLRHRSNPNAVDRMGSTPLHEAANNLDGDEVVQLLLKHGADVDRKNVNGDTALDIATQRIYSSIIQLLVNRGATTSKVDTNKIIEHLKNNNWRF